MISPSSLAVFALKFLQKSMMLTPWGPSAVPTGGAGGALPAAIWSFTIACTFFAITFYLSPRNSRNETVTKLTKNLLWFRVFRPMRDDALSWLDLLHLQKIE